MDPFFFTTVTANLSPAVGASEGFGLWVVVAVVRL